MKAKQFLPALLLLLGACTFFSCKDDGGQTIDVPGKYAEGIFVVNEGPFGGTGTITWHDPETGETVQDVFAKENGGAVLGQFVQSLTFHNGRGYIVVNGANKVYVVEQGSFKYIDVIEGLAMPRFLLPLDDHFAYVSQWGANGLDGSVALVDLQTLDIVQTIPTGHGPDKMARFSDGLVYVPNSGGFGVDSTVSLIDANHQEARLPVGGKNPGTVARLNYQNTSFVYAHCRGSFLDATPAGWVGPLTETGYVTPAYGDDLVASPDGFALYYTAGGGIWRLRHFVSPEKIIDQAAYGLACDPETGDLYCADAKDFSSAGEVVTYTAAGNRVGAFPVGIAPGEIVVVK